MFIEYQPIAKPQRCVQAMRTIQILILSILSLNVLTSHGQIKSLYFPIDYCSDSTKDILVSCFAMDSLKYEILYYRDLLAESQRNSFTQQNTYKIDTVLLTQDSMTVNYYSKNDVIIHKKVYKFTNLDKKSFFLNEDYYSIEGKIIYGSRIIVNDKVFITDYQNQTENVGPWEQLQFRYRYSYNEEGILVKVVNEYRIGGAGQRSFRFTNTQFLNTDNYRLFPQQKISIWEFWD